MFILKKGHQPGVYVPLRALFLVLNDFCIDSFLNILKESLMEFHQTLLTHSCLKHKHLK